MPEFRFWSLNGITVHPVMGDIITSDAFMGGMRWRAGTNYREGVNYPENRSSQITRRLAISPDGTTLALSLNSFPIEKSRGMPWLGSIL